MSAREAFFPWYCKTMGAIFLIKGFATPYVCPSCGKKDAFESGDCRRIWASEFGIK